MTELNSNCCPRCGCETALDDLDDEIRKLREEKKRREWLAKSAGIPKVTSFFGNRPTGHSVINYREHEIRLDASTCSQCGTLWDRKAATKAREKREEIAKLHAEVYDVVERLGFLSGSAPVLSDEEEKRLKEFFRDV